MRGLFYQIPVVLLSITFLPKARASCYYPDGSFPTDYAFSPCTGDQYTTCCIPSEGDKCLSNGLCSWTAGGEIFRGACTDKTWNSTNCLNHCTQGTDAAKWVRIISCGSNQYCCQSTTDICCNDSSQVFELPVGQVVKDFGATTLLPENTGAAPTVGSASTVTGVVPAFSTLATSAKTTTTAGIVPNPSSTSKSSSSSGTTAHAVVGGIVGFAVVAALVLGFCCARGRYKRQIRRPPMQVPYQSDIPFQPIPPASPLPTKRALTPTITPTVTPAIVPPGVAPVRSTPELDSTAYAPPQGPPPQQNQGPPIYEAPAVPYQAPVPRTYYEAP
ncbi:hypothetical protein K432DRAFT_378443 [Lepidopterella palustris CBS 459.81]|uniref:Mid2 domain-containing protein n=1 Tax=Lepidopterella palustris CBS 459.81 TaxID=1314670 RepID=A0A8E2EIG2_9PEZI|nr:hypothetical protein K432DRAFT_378443 [Lepidopterella palustris CBS 459.81]